MEIGTHDPANMPDGWVTLPGGGIVPPALAARVTGWGGDRDSTDIPKITEARTAMAEAVTAYHVAYGHMLADGADMVASMVAVIAKADAMAEAWHKFTEVTGGAE